MRQKPMDCQQRGQKRNYPANPDISSLHAGLRNSESSTHYATQEAVHRPQCPFPKKGYLLVHEGSLPYGLDTKHDESEGT